MSLITDWDSGQPLADWDDGLQWDVNLGPGNGDVTPYLNRIIPEHKDKPNFMAMIAASAQPFADILAILRSMPALFDLDGAVGDQLDTDGEWIGISRDIAIPLSGVFFSWNVAGIGWNQGNWTSGITNTELISLPDAQYRTLLYARIAANHWDGTISGAYAVWDLIFAGTGIGVLIQDLQRMHMVMALTGPVPDAVTLALFTNGFFNLKPAGVRIDKYYTPVQPNVPYFGWNVANNNIAGWNLGYWGVQSAGA